MKKYFVFFFFLSFFGFINVHAEDEYLFNYKEMELIPIDEVASVDTKAYEYIKFHYEKNVSRQTYALLRFELVRNKSVDEKPLAVDVLLFDQNKKNIGFVAYCTTKDLVGDQAQLTFSSGAASVLDIIIDEEYFIENYTKNDVYYIAILDGNDNCYVGNSNKYGGLTIEEISQGMVSPDWHENEILNIFSFILNVGIYTFLAIVFVVIVLFVLYSALLNSLNKSMFGKKSSICYFPILNFAQSVNLSFGRILAFFYFNFLLYSVYSVYFNSEWLFLNITIVFTIVSFLINVFKFFTGKYDFMHFDPFIKNDGTNPVYSWKKVRIKGNRKAQKILDLNYNESDLKNGFNVEKNGSSTFEFTPVVNEVFDDVAKKDTVETSEKFLAKLDEEANTQASEGFTFSSSSDTDSTPSNDTLPKLEKLDDTPASSDDGKDENDNKKKEDDFMDMFR